MKKFNSVTTGTIVVAVVFVIVSSSLPLIGFMSEIGFLSILFLLFWSYFSITTLYNCFGKKIHIDENGIRFITPFKMILMTWDDIKEIGTSRLYIGLRGGARIIYFSTKYGASTADKDDTLIIMRYRKSALDEVKKYWKARISERQI